MKQIPHISFATKDEKTAFNQIIMNSNDETEAIEKVRSTIKNDKGEPVSLALATTAVGIFWEKKESYLKRFSK